jgi:hypothetical protein
MKRNLLYLLILATAAAAAQDKPKAKKPYSCSAGPDEVCPSDLWYADYLVWHATNMKYSVPKDVQDLQNGRAQRLNKEIPPGYEWSDAKQRFVKMKPQVPVPTPAPVQPAATEKK